MISIRRLVELAVGDFYIKKRRIFIVKIISGCLELLIVYMKLAVTTKLKIVLEIQLNKYCQRCVSRLLKF